MNCLHNWEYVRIGDVCTVERGGSPRPIEQFITDDPNGINWIKIGDTNDSMYITSTAQKIVPEGMKKSRYVQPGDFLLSNSMSFGRPYILKIDGCIHDGWLVLRDDNGLFDKKFLYYYLSAPSTYQKFKNMAVGGVVNNLNSDMVRKVTVPVPTMEEQVTIVSVLDRVTRLIAMRKEQLAKLDELVKARFVEMFGDPVSNPMGWECKRFDSLCENLDYRRKPITASERESGIYPYYGASGIVDYVAGYLFDEDILLISEDGANLLMRSTPIAFSVSGKVWVNNHAHVLRFEKMCMQKYVEMYFSMIDISEFITGSAQPKLNQAKLNSMMIPVPDDDGMNSYLQFIQQTNKTKLTIQASLDKLEVMKKALMQEYFG